MEVPVAVAGWANHATTFMSFIDSYKTKELFCDCTLACDRKFFRAHKMILAMSSELFENIFINTEDKNPVIILHEIEAWQVECLLNYMYKGETKVSDSHFISLCKVAKSLQIKGFDKLELYREAVKKQSGRMESRFPKNSSDDSQNELTRSSGSPIRDTISPKSSYTLQRTNQLGSNTNIYESNDSGVQQNSPHLNRCSSSGPQDSKGQYSTPFEASTCSPLSKDSFTQDLSLKSRIKNEEPTTVSSSQKSTSLPSPFNFKKKYLLSMSQSYLESQKLNHMSCSSPEGEEGATDRVSNSSPITQRFDATIQESPPPPPPPLPVPSHSFKSEESLDLQDTCEPRIPPGGPKPLRGPPPLLRIVYNGSPEENEIKIDTETPHDPLKQEIPSYHHYPYDYSLPYNRLPPIDNYFQTTLISEPGNDPLLRKIPTNKRKRVRGPKSWEFLLRLLRSPESNPSLIKWENEEAGIFRLIRPEIIALRWGRRTGKHVHDILSYESFSRGLRYHYATGALCAVSEKSFVYQFGPKAQEALRSSRDLKTELKRETSPTQ